MGPFSGLLCSGFASPSQATHNARIMPLVRVSPETPHKILRRMEVTREMKGVIYARYSSDSQREESIEGQLRECRAFADKNDIEIIETYIDRAFSAKTDNRPDFQRMIRESTRKKYDVILVWKLDRFARDKYDSAHYKRQLRNNGIRVISATEAISDGPEGVLLESLLEGMAQYYSDELSIKVVRGMTDNALKCKYNGGSLPLGFTIDGEQRYMPDPVTAPLVLKAFTDYANGKSMRRITDDLNLAGARTNRDGKMSINSVTRLLHNRRYIGEYKYRDIVNPHGIPAIVPEDLFERVQEKLRLTKKAPARFKAEDEYLLTTKLFCGKCKCFMAGESGTSHTGVVHRYYKCVSVKNHKGCDKKSVQKEWIEGIVISQIKKLLWDDELIEKLADMGVERQGMENTVLPMLKRQLAEAEKGIGNMLNAIQQGIITESTKQRLEQLEQRKKELEKQIAREELLRPPLFTREQFLFWFERMRKYDTKKLEHRRRLIDSFVNAIYLFDDRITFTFNFKNGTQTITFAELEESGLGSDIKALGAPLKMTGLNSPVIFSALLLLWDLKGERKGNSVALSPPRVFRRRARRRRCKPASRPEARKTSPIERIAQPGFFFTQNAQKAFIHIAFLKVHDATWISLKSSEITMGCTRVARRLHTDFCKVLLCECGFGESRLHTFLQISHTANLFCLPGKGFPVVLRTSLWYNQLDNSGFEGMIRWPTKISVLSKNGWIH